LSEPLISVVSPVRNAAHLVGGLLAALEAQSLPADDFETIVVDDGSTDGTPEILARWEAADPRRRRVLRAPGRGPAAARNAGTAAARGEWIAFTDADVLPEPRWLEHVLLAGGDADAVEGRTVPWPVEDLRPDSHYVQNERGGLYVTANMAYRREVLERLGGFDESFRDAFLEDSDLAFRALDDGARFVFAPDALVRHRVINKPPLATLRSTRKLRWLPLLAAKHPQRYRTEIAPIIRPVTRPDAHVLAGLAGLALLTLRGAPRAAGALLAVNAVRVVARDPRAREGATGTALAVALPVAKVAAWLDGYLRYGR
jgi:glycosyltransferase involved in cell wall biosynthesis